MANHATPEAKIEAFWTARAQGMNIKDAAVEAGCSYKQARSWDQGRIQRANAIRERLMDEGLSFGPGNIQLRSEARKGLENFEYFRRRYWGHVSRPWQVNLADHVVRIFDSHDAPADEFGRHYLVANMPPGGGKALALDTPLATPTGWTTMKDVQIGMQVLGDDGKPCTVTYKSEVFYDHDCYEVTTDDGCSIIADADHLWRAQMEHDRPAGYKPRKDAYPGKTGPKITVEPGWRIYTTTDLARPRSKRPCIPLTAPLDLPERELPIDPYILGCWLGDGTTTEASVTIGDEDIDHFRAEFARAGHPLIDRPGSPITYGISNGFRTLLRRNWLLGAKFVPYAYLKASQSQRLALLQGLIDTDGHVDTKGRIEFTTTKKNLAVAVRSLIHSLGYKASMLEHRTSLRGVDCGPRWRVNTKMPDAARLPRKADRCKPLTRSTGRYVTARPIESVPTQCITVDSPNRCYLAGEGLVVTHNTSWARDTASWLIVRDRTVRILWGSRTEGQSQDNVRLVRDILGTPVPAFVSEQDKRRRGAIDPTGCLSIDYGAFKPPRGGQWDSKSFTVVLPGDQIGTNKENTMAAYGQDSGFLGGRYDLSFWDDLVDQKNYRTIDARDKLRQWWDTQAESRVEPGGLVVLLGQRLSPDDLYRYNLDKTAVIFDENGEEVYSPEARKYHHIVYPAHFDERCEGIHSPKVAKPWPDGCLLDPTALTWQVLRTEQSNNDSNYRIVYQQEDIDPSSALVKRVWVEGGQDSDGVFYHGCYDEDRNPFSKPKRPGTYWSVITVDPSGVKNWATQWWAIHHQTQDRYLIASFAGSMYANELLDNDPSGGFTGLLEDWWQIGRRISLPVTHVIVEHNTTQRWLKDFDHWKRWTRSRQVLGVGHATNKSTKLDPDKGVSILRTPFKHGLIRLPGTFEGRKMSAQLVTEVTHYPFGTTSDQVMAAWFMEHWLPTHGRKRDYEGAGIMARPSWAGSANDRPTWIHSVKASA